MLDKAAPIWTPMGRCGLGEAPRAAVEVGGDTTTGGGGGGATSADPKMAAAASFSSVELLLT